VARRLAFSAFLLSSAVLLVTQVGDAAAMVNSGVKATPGTTWAIQGTPRQLDTASVGAGISCGSPTSCVAVGEMSSISGPEIPFTETWSGSLWSPGPSATWTGQLGAENYASSSAYAGVSCSSATFCEAVGWSSYPVGLGSEPASTLAASWNGSGWTTQLTPNVGPPTDGANDLTSVSCVSSTFCTAVGWSVGPDSGSQATMALVWNGTAWSVEPTPVLTGNSVLDGVSCATSTECEAVGNSGGLPLAESWNGSAWTVQTIPQPAGATSSSLSSLSCVTDGSCSAVGSYSGASGTDSFAESWDGASWALQPVPEPAGTTSSQLSAVSCTGTGTLCTAVGGYDAGTGSLTLAETWNGAGWLVQPTPSPGETGSSSLSGVSCAAGSQCQAVGTDSANNAIAEGFSGTSWIPESIHDGGFKAEDMSGVSCTSTSDCQGVGQYSGENLADGWSGSAWSLEVQSLEWIQGYFEVSSSLQGVSCPAATKCFAVGTSDYVDPGNELDGPFLAIETWDGSSWTKQLIFDIGSLNGISCPTKRACTAVGTSPQVGGAIVEAFNGSTWTLQTPAVPEGGKNTKLAAVSCVSAASCIAVGSYTDSSRSKIALVENWNGTSWKVQPTPAPTGATATRLTGISCAQVSACTAVGWYTNGVGDAESLAESWNGTTWTIEPVPTPNGSSSSKLNGVSCPSPTACTAVGAAGPNVLVEIWNGSTWAIQQAAIPYGATSSSLNGVSCPIASSSSACTVVGTFTDDAGQHTLAESTSTSGPFVKRQPWNESVNPGGSATFISIASGDPQPSVQWQVSSDGGQTWTSLADGVQTDGSVVSGAETTQLTISNAQSDVNGFEYEAVFSNSVASATSDVGNLNVG
jgi:hypothetical protein